MSSRLKAKLLKRMLLGVASEKEKQKVFSSRESDSMLEQVWSHDTSELSESIPFDKQKLFQEISKKIDSNSSLTTRWHQKTSYRIAASLAAVIALSVSVFFLIRPNGKFADKEMLSYSSGGSISNEIVLSDGSKILLNKRTTLRYPKIFSKKERRVELLGEAIFEVTHKPSQPFVVVANGVEVEVLGTVFNVMAYPTDDKVTATLISGKVKVKYIDPNSKKEQTVVLAANHSATFIPSQNRFEISKVDVEAVTAWERGELVFNDEPLESIVSKLTRWYDVELILSNDLKGKYRLTLTIDNETLDETLLIISKAIPVEYSKSEKQVLIYPKQ